MPGFMGRTVHLLVLGYNSVDDNTDIFVLLLPDLPPKSAKSCEIPRKFTVIQGHPPWCQSKAHMRLPASY